MCVKEKCELLLQIYFLWSKMVVTKKMAAYDHAKFISFWHSVSTMPTILGCTKQPMRMQLDECNNIGQTSEVRKYCVISLSSKSVSICIDSILTQWNPLRSIAQLGHNYDAEEWTIFHTWFFLSLRRPLSYFVAHTPSAIIFVLVGAETKQLFSELPIYS